MGALGALPIRQQIGLLFVALFGLLFLALLGSFLYSLREMDEEQRERYEQFTRDLRAVWIGAILFWLGWVAGRVFATVLFAVVAFLAFREFITLSHTRRGDHRALLAAFFVVLPVQFWLATTSYLVMFTVFIPVYMFLALPVLAALGNDPQRFLERTAKIQWGVMVCIYGMSHAPALLLLKPPGGAAKGAFLVFYLVMVVATAQIVQEAATRWLRRRPVARAISRSFSWRAFGLGVFAGGWVGAFMYWATPFGPVPALVMGFLAAGSGMFGDLVMRALKRDAGVRYWSGRASVTGAVGLLDRVAPLCFAAPVFFHSVRWFWRL
jgi:phosphatidate cytidylyltransferase